MDPLTLIAAAIAIGSLKRLTEAGYDTTSYLLKKLLDIVSADNPDVEVRYRKTKEITEIEDYLGSNTNLDSDSVQKLVELSGDLISSVSEKDRKELSNQSKMFTNLFKEHDPIDPLFSESISKTLSNIDTAVQYLTAEQFRVMRIIHPFSRVHINGSPGSGKTLVAVESAIRRSKLGNKVLIICHSKKLTDHIKKLVGTSKVEVDFFTRYCHRLIGSAEPRDWNHYSNLTHESLNECVEKIKLMPSIFDTVIIDEAQDFEKGWWQVINMLAPSGQSDLLIFSDERQSLIPGRDSYPSADVELDISRNCRNSGAVFEHMRQMDSSLPAVDPLLKGLGIVDSQFPNRNLKRNLLRGLRAAVNYNLLHNTVILFGNGYEKLIEDIQKKSIRSNDHHLRVWRNIVIDFFEYALRKANREVKGYRITTSNKSRAEVESLDKRLSRSYLPNDLDKSIIASISKTFRFRNNSDKIRDNEPPYISSGFKLNHFGDLVLAGVNVHHGNSLSNLFSINSNIEYFSAPQWSLPSSADFEVQVEFNGEMGQHNIVPAYRIEDFKGLESECVILFPDFYKSSLNEKRRLVGASRAKKVLIEFPAPNQR